jgi:hypothetical protein
MKYILKICVGVTHEKQVSGERFIASYISDSLYQTLRQVQN